MNRRRLLVTGAILTVVGGQYRARAEEIGLTDSLVTNVFDLLPDAPAADGYDFPVTTGTIGPFQRNVWPENPDMYWDPVGEDYRTIFGFHPNWMQLYASQDDASIWFMDRQLFDHQQVRDTLELNSWKLIDSDLRLLHFHGSEKERSNLAASLNMLTDHMVTGDWDWVALPADDVLVMGSNEERVHLIADRVKHDTPMSTVSNHISHLRPIIRADSYRISVLPSQRLPMEGSDVSFVSRSWTGDLPIIQSIGISLDSRERADRLPELVGDRLESETSSVQQTEYADFLSIHHVEIQDRLIRFDFVDSSTKWDVFEALSAGDLGMLPAMKQTQ